MSASFTWELVEILSVPFGSDLLEQNTTLVLGVQDRLMWVISAWHLNQLSALQLLLISGRHEEERQAENPLPHFGVSYLFFYLFFFIYKNKQIHTLSIMMNNLGVAAGRSGEIPHCWWVDCKGGGGGGFELRLGSTHSDLIHFIIFACVSFIDLFVISTQNEIAFHFEIDLSI